MYQKIKAATEEFKRREAVIKRLIKVDNSEPIDDGLAHFIISSDPRLR
jgi:hypothetical protein